MIVADTNLIVYLHITGDQSPSALRVLERDPYWISPPLWQSEFRNALAGFMRRGMPLEQAQRIMAEALLLMSNRQVSPHPSRILNLVSTSECTAYDCEFVALADQLSIPLVTADQLLLKNFPKIAVSLNDFVTE
jgi:predicted nucleic acid-binding protein